MQNAREQQGQKDARRDRGFGGKPNALLNFFVRLYLLFWFFRFPRKLDKQFRQKHKGASILIANHPGSLDAFLLGCAINPNFTNFVGSQHFFRFQPLRLLLKWEGVIPKSLSQKDFQALRLMKRSLDAGRVLMIFPQGHRSMDGTGSQFAESFAKFVKKCGVSVNAAHLSGSYLAWPRWADKPARGPLSVSFQTVLSQEEVQVLSVEVIHQRLLAATEFDEYASALQENRQYRTKKRTDHIERLLHLCPVCREMEAITGCGDRVICRRCGATAMMAANGCLRQLSGTPIIWPTVPQWYSLQRAEIAKRMHVLPFSIDLGNCTLKSANHPFQRCEPIAEGTAVLSREGLAFQGTALQPSSIDTKRFFPITLFHTTAISLGHYLQICDESDINWQFCFAESSKVVILAQIVEMILV